MFFVVYNYIELLIVFFVFCQLNLLCKNGGKKDGKKNYWKNRS